MAHYIIITHEHFKKQLENVIFCHLCKTLAVTSQYATEVPLLR